MHSFEEQTVGLGLDDLAEDSDEERDMRRANGNGNVIYSTLNRHPKLEER